jgi:hypothetical protein
MPRFLFLPNLLPHSLVDFVQIPCSTILLGTPLHTV